MVSHGAFGRAAISAAVLVAGSLVSVVAAGDAVAAGGTLTMGPSSPIIGEHVTAQGRLSTHLARPVELQQKAGSSWATRVKGKSRSGGGFELTVRAASTPGEATYRVLAPKVRVHGHTYPAIQTSPASVHSVGQTAVLSVPAADRVGSEAAASSTFTPARSGRLVELQRLVSGSWTTIASSNENSAGDADLAFTPSTAGSYTLRVLAAPVNGATSAASANETTVVTPQSTWLQLNTDSDTSCGVKTDHTGWCWGWNNYGTLGNPIYNVSTQPLQLAGSWSSLSTSHYTTCGIQTDGTGWCWGSNYSGEVGIGETTPGFVGLPAELPGTWTSLHTNSGTTCGIRTDDTGWCWGANNHGQAGVGDTTNWRIYTPQELPGHWSELDNGSPFGVTCGVQTDGTGWCWGDDRTGAVGDMAAQDGTADPMYAPFQLPGTGWTHIVTSGLTSCGVRSDATGWCWGALPGDGSDGTNTPTQLPGSWASFSAAAMSLQPFHNAEQNVCGVQTDNTGWCWQGNDEGQLGNGSTAASGTWAKSPVQVPGAWSSLSTNSDITCGVKTDHTASCWGYNEYGQVGNGTSGYANLVLSPATLPGTWSSISEYSSDARQGPGDDTCGIQQDGTGWCWGYNGDGTAGNGTRGVHNSPVEVN
jgi:alpha-tubulin suppressor-like RCC1 family protein